MTVVAAGTSAPELVVSVDAALSGSPGLALGNVIGSNICNILLILGLSAVLSPVRVDSRAVRRDLKVLVASAIVLGGLVLTGYVGRVAGLLLVAAHIVYVVVSYRTELKRPTEAGDLYEEQADEFEGPKRPLWIDIAFVVGGIAVLVVGSRLLVSGATEIARSLGVSEAVIGLTLVALGTSFPELATSTVAAVRGHSDVAVGNVVGSNIFNSLFIIGVAALAAPMEVPAGIAAADVGVMLAASVAAAIVLWGGRLGRLGGAIGLAGYAAYVLGRLPLTQSRRGSASSAQSSSQCTSPLASL